MKPANVTKEEFSADAPRAAYLIWIIEDGTRTDEGSAYKVELDAQTVNDSKWGAKAGDALFNVKRYGRKAGRTSDHPRYDVRLWREVVPMAGLHVNLRTAAITISDDELREIGMRWFLVLQQMAARLVELLG